MAPDVQFQLGVDMFSATFVIPVELVFFLVIFLIIPWEVHFRAPIVVFGCKMPSF